MLAWIARGLRQGRVTTRYPRVPESPPAGYRGSVSVRGGAGAPVALAGVCPTGAIAVDAGRASIDRRRCILCGECVRAAPERFAFVGEYETAQGPDVALGDRARALRRSIHVRHVDCGSDGSEEWEIQALWNPYYDAQRLGFFLTAAPRHADVLLVTGPVTAPMRTPLLRTWQVMPEPKALLAVGTDACGGGLCAGDRNRAGTPTAGGVDEVLAVDVYVPGSPPAPIAILHGLLLVAGLLSVRREAA